MLPMSMPMEQMGQSCMFELAQTVWRMIRQICGSGVPARLASCWIQSRIASRESMVGAYRVSLATIVVLSLGAGGGGSIVVVLRHAIKLSDAIRQKVIMVMESCVCQQRPRALLKRRKLLHPALQMTDCQRISILSMSVARPKCGFSGSWLYRLLINWTQILT